MSFSSPRVDSQLLRNCDWSRSDLQRCHRNPGDTIVSGQFPSKAIVSRQPTNKRNSTLPQALKPSFFGLDENRVTPQMTWKSLSLLAGVPSLLLFLSSPLLASPSTSPLPPCPSGGGQFSTRSHPPSSPAPPPPSVPRPLLLLSFLAAMYMFSGERQLR